jgi:hypothetical protein
MVQVSYTKDQGLKQQSGSASFSIESGIPVSSHIKDVVTSNTVATIDFAGIKHAETPSGALEFNLDSKVIYLNSNGGDNFYIWISVSDEGDAADPQITGRTGVELNVVAAAINSESGLVSSLANLINTDPGLSAEFEAANANDNLVIRSLRMGRSSSIVPNISDFVGLIDANNNNAEVSATVGEVPGVGSHILSTGGISNVSNAIPTGNDSFVILPNLTSGDHYGARKIVIRPANGNDFILKDKDLSTLHTFDAEGDVAHLVWNGSVWKRLYFV